MESSMEKTTDSSILIAIVQSQDAEFASQTLKAEGFETYQLPSVGGFLGRKNNTLIIQSSEKDREKIIGLLKNSCSQRVEFVAIPVESAQLAIPTPTQITVGGAAVFSIAAEKIEKL